MAVKITKPEINVREKLAELDKPSGIAGEAMLRAETVAEQQALIGVGRRNILINGGFQVSQRGDFTSATTITNSTYYLDRYRADIAGFGGTIQHKVNGFSKGVNSVRLTATSAATGYMGLVQKWNDTENPILFSGVITLSAWVKSSLSKVNLYMYSGGQRNPVLYTGNGEWQKLVTTFDSSVYSAGDFNIFNYDGTGEPVVVGDYIEIAQMQAELGKVATPFEHRSYGEELALCQRYFTVMPNGIFGIATGITSIVYSYHLPTQMRATPSVSLTSTNQRQGDTVAQGIDLTSASISISTYANSSVAAFSISGTPSANFTAYRMYLYEGTAAFPAQVHLSAEL